MVLILFLLILLPTAKGAVIDVTVADYVDADIIGLKHEEFGVGMKTTFEAFNSGSVGCKAIFRLDLSNENQELTLWSRPVNFQPNEREIFEFYWFSLNNTGNFTGKVKYYCANEIKEVENFDIYLKEYLLSKPTIEINSVKFFENKIVLHIKPTVVGEFVILASDYPKSWKIEQKKFYARNSWIKYVELNYEADVWREGKMKIIVLNDKRDYGIKEVELKKEKKLNEILFRLTSFVRSFLQ
ncbi:MAG: hypothetical protein NZ893_02980 [Candidatus Aenigmarchaeota archaeon]|nr:hypothetical protein [Candidatus Aenigmarchaeota archaeon]